MKGEQDMVDHNDWNQPWFSQLSWVMGNLERFDLDPNQKLVVAVLAFLNDTHLPFTPDIICEKTGLDEEVVDDVYDFLITAGYGRTDSRNKQLFFNLEGLLDLPAANLNDPVSQSLLREFSTEFGRPLSGSEMERILNLSNEFDEDMILHALDEASAYNKRSLNYVESLLAAWKSRGLDAADIESGKR